MTAHLNNSHFIEQAKWVSQYKSQTKLLKKELNSLLKIKKPNQSEKTRIEYLQEIIQSHNSLIEGNNDMFSHYLHSYYKLNIVSLWIVVKFYFYKSTIRQDIFNLYVNFKKHPIIKLCFHPL